jgi:hypothetical protein
MTRPGINHQLYIFAIRSFASIFAPTHWLLSPLPLVITIKLESDMTILVVVIPRSASGDNPAG